jgi:hypothetical protein
VVEQIGDDDQLAGGLAELLVLDEEEAFPVA